MTRRSPMNGPSLAAALLLLAAACGSNDDSSESNTRLEADGDETDGQTPSRNQQNDDTPESTSSPDGDAPNGATEVDDLPVVPGGVVAPGVETLPGGGSPSGGSGGVAQAPASGVGGATMQPPAVGGTGNVEEAACASGVADAVYDRYVAPLVDGGQPSSCNQCHLSGVNLGNFVRSTPCESMACLMQSGEVDLDDPTNSKILERIQLADPASGLITQPIIDREYDGFLAWIEYSARCQETLCGEMEDACGGQPAPLDVPEGPLGQCTEQQLVDQFDRSVYSTLAGRCAGCHDPEGPKFEPDAVLWLDLREGGALRTLYNLVGRGSFNTESPEMSMLLLKPLAEAAGGVLHLGGDKFADKTDATYIESLRFIEAYADCKNTGQLGEFSELPTVSIVTPRTGEVRPNPVRLDGLAIDAQEGQIVNPVSWESDRDGSLGQQPVLAEVTLSSGSHTLTFTARDGDGNEAQASVTFEVE